MLVSEVAECSIGRLTRPCDWPGGDDAGEIWWQSRETLSLHLTRRHSLSVWGAADVQNILPLTNAQTRWLGLSS